ncbi:MAG: hypothetical protein RMY64_08150 [Nostoc sp. DedQUE08]|nr:hypothetical protein [Nostoc sp. DedQUE08]
MIVPILDFVGSLTRRLRVRFSVSEREASRSLLASRREEKIAENS